MNDREPREDPARTGGHPEFRSDLVGPHEDRGPSGVQVRPDRTGSDPVGPGPTQWQDKGPSGIDKIFTQRVDFL